MITAVFLQFVGVAFFKLSAYYLTRFIFFFYRSINNEKKNRQISLCPEYTAFMSSWCFVHVPALPAATQVFISDKKKKVALSMSCSVHTQPVQCSHLLGRQFYLWQLLLLHLQLPPEGSPPLWNSPSPHRLLYIKEPSPCEIKPFMIILHTYSASEVVRRF